jgi:hypothetical protein
MRDAAQAAIPRIDFNLEVRVAQQGRVHAQASPEGVLVMR